MTESEEIRLHNLFIKFSNEGKSEEEISNLLGDVNKKQLSIWKAKLEKAKANQINLPSSIKTKVVGVDKGNNYLYNNSIEIDLNWLGGAKLHLSSIIANIKKGKKPDEIQLSAKKYLPIFQKYFIEFSLDFENEKKVNASFKLNTSDQAINKLANEAISFYATIFANIKHFKNSGLIKESTPDSFKKTNGIMPFALKSFSAKNNEGIVKTGFEGIPIDTNWIFLIGENGFGKTTILRTIATGFIGEKDEDIELFKVNIDREIGVTNGIGIEYFSFSQSVINNVGFSIVPFPHLACYGPSRLQPQNKQTQNDISKKSSTTYSLFNSDGILLNIEYSMVIWYLKEDPKFEAVKSVFKKLIPYLADIQITDDEKVLYIEKEPVEDGQIYKAVNFNQLASGFRSIILMVGDMMIRLYKSQPHIKEPSELAGIVIIDELDLHWHPKMQREIPSLLSSIFPKVQFIASTHSLVPLLGAPENSVLLEVNRTKEAGITVEKVDIDFAALSADTMLRDIFDLENYMSDAKIKAWDKFIELKGLIHFEKDEAKKQVHWKELERIADKYQFEL